MSSEDESIGDGGHYLDIIEEGEEVQTSPREEVNEGVDENEQIAENVNEENAEDENKKVVKPKRVIRNPQPKLNEQTLKGQKGLAAIEGYFERVKFKGRGHEEQDLNVLMKTYEYWCHRLFPKFPFDDCIARLEKLGTKKVTRNQIKRIRLGLDFDDDKPIISDEEANEEANDTGGFVDTYNDQFDQLLPAASKPVTEMTEEQLERMRQNKERAQRLREERLRKITEKAQNNLGESSQININSQEAETTEHFLDNNIGINYIRNMDERLNTIENSGALNTIVGGNYSGDDVDTGTNINENMNESESRLNQQEDNEFDSALVSRKKNMKKKKYAIESDSEDEIFSEINKDVTVKNNTRRILESDEELDNGVGSIENERETGENNVENILNEINTDNNYAVGNKNGLDQQDNILVLKEKNTTKKMKYAIESDSEDKGSNKINRDETVKKNKTRRILESDEELDNGVESTEGENDVENILNEINTDNSSEVGNKNGLDQQEDDILVLKEKNTNKKTKYAIQRDSEDKITTEINRDETVKKNKSQRILESDEELDNGVESAETNDNIENILDEINTDSSYAEGNPDLHHTEDAENRISSQDIHQPMDTAEESAYLEEIFGIHK